MSFSRLAKRKKTVSDLPYTLEETKEIINQMNKTFSSLCADISVAAQSENRELVLQLIEQAKNTNNDINTHELYLKKLEENPDEYQMLMW